MDAAWSAGEDPVVGVVDREGEATDADRSGSAGIDAIDPSTLSTVDATHVSGDLEEVLAADPSVLVTAGEAALAAAARTGVDTPILPVGPVSGIESVVRDGLVAALDAVLDGDVARRPRSVLGVTLESGSADDHDPDSASAVDERALFDVTLVTDEPARISEYGVRSRGSDIATFRADGVVAATPAGSHGYASAVEAPQLSPALDALAVAPIAPFVTQTRRWVLPNDDLAVTVERDEGDVTLVADGRSVGTVTVDSRVTVSVVGTLPTLVVPGYSEL